MMDDNTTEPASSAELNVPYNSRSCEFHFIALVTNTFLSAKL